MLAVPCCARISANWNCAKRIPVIWTPVLLSLSLLICGCRSATTASVSLAAPTTVATGIEVPPARQTAASLAADRGVHPGDVNSRAAATATRASARKSSATRQRKVPGAATSPVAKQRANADATARARRAAKSRAVASPAAANKNTSGKRSRSSAVISLPPGAVAPNGLSCPAEAPIKATTSHVYHVPTSATYRTVHPVVCFASTADAQAAGYRAAAR